MSMSGAGMASDIIYSIVAIKIILVVVAEYTVERQQR